MPLPPIKISDLGVEKGDTIELEEGRIYSLCSCGYSAKLPFCDNAHKDHAPDFKSIKVEVKRGGKVRIYDTKND